MAGVRASVPVAGGRTAAGQHGPWQHRPMRPADLDDVLAIEVRCYSHPWTRGNFADSLASGYLGELRESADDGLVGYWVALPGVEELHLLNITVAPEWRRAGHGRALLRRVIACARARGDHSLWLEVRPSNASARALYRAEGFAEVGLRRGYYPADRGREDALVMRLALDPPAAPASAGDAHALD